MFHKSGGIVLHSTKYSENSLIVKIYTESFGLQSYLIRTSKNRKSKIKAGIFQPLTLLDFIISHNKKKDIQFIKEITQCRQFSGITFDIKKSSIAIFIAEILGKVIREEEQNKSLFGFIYNSIQTLDSTEKNVSKFHLVFLLELSKYLGFSPQSNYDNKNCIFNLYEGRFREHLPEHPYFIEKELSQHFNDLIGLSYDKIETVQFSSTIKKELLNKILDYYRIHINGFNIVRSHKVLEDIFLYTYLIFLSWGII